MLRQEPRLIGLTSGPGVIAGVRDFFSQEVGERLRLHGWTFLRDALVVAAAYIAADAARFDGVIPQHYLHLLLLALPLTVLVYGMFSYLHGIHRRLWTYADMSDIRAIVDASALSFLVIAIGTILLGHDRFFPLSVVLVGSLFAPAGLLTARLWPRLSRDGSKERKDADRVLIVGAGQAGQLVAADLLSHGESHEPVAFLDDDPRKHSMSIRGIPVVDRIDRLPEIVAEYGVDTIAIAIPSATTRELDRVLALAQETDARIQVLPSQSEVLSGRSQTMHLQDINLNSLLDRIPSSDGLQGQLTRASVAGKVVLVTGGAGSIGSEICRQLVTLGPKQVLALDNNETGLFYLQQELAGKPGGELLTPVLTSVTAGPKLKKVFAQYGPDVVFHAAAYKHVPMLQTHVDEAVFVNVKGTLNVCECAVEFGCERMVFISTDKAVDPVNTLGFSKRIGELLARAHQQGANTIFCAVRFGNVIGSRGSALPEFLRQIDAGGPVTVTHPDVERYFMTIPEAVSLVIQAGAQARGGEIFMLDMGQPIKIGDLVKRLIRLRGLRVGKDIEIVYTGLRPGEKLTEELVFDSENTRPTAILGINVVENDDEVDLDDLTGAIEILVNIAADESNEAIVDALRWVAGWKADRQLWPHGLAVVRAAA